MTATEPDIHYVIAGPDGLGKFATLCRVPTAPLKEAGELDGGDAQYYMALLDNKGRLRSTRDATCERCKDVRDQALRPYR